MNDTIRRQLAADVHKLAKDLPLRFELLTPPEIIIKPSGRAADVYYRYAGTSQTAIEIPDIEFDPETGSIVLPGHRFGVLVLQ